MYRLLDESRPCSNLGRWKSVVGPFTQVVGWTFFGDLFLRNPDDGRYALLALWWSRFKPLRQRTEPFEKTFLRTTPVIEQLLCPADVLVLEARLGKLGPEDVFFEEACPFPAERGDSLTKFGKMDVWEFAALTAACHRIGENAVLDMLLRYLGPGDDDRLWRAVLDAVLADLAVVGVTTRTLVEVGRCSHWLRPHQTRWTAGGGFAWPTGYGGTAYSRTGLPEFDWSVVLRWTGQSWAVATKDKRALPGLRVAIPSRTTRHRQAAIHTLWTFGRREEMHFYGFRRAENGGVWSCTAESEWDEDRLPIEVKGAVSPRAGRRRRVI